MRKRNATSTDKQRRVRLLAALVVVLGVGTPLAVWAGVSGRSEAMWTLICVLVMILAGAVYLAFAIGARLGQ